MQCASLQKKPMSVQSGEVRGIIVQHDDFSVSFQTDHEGDEAQNCIMTLLGKDRIWELNNNSFSVLVEALSESLRHVESDRCIVLDIGDRSLLPFATLPALNCEYISFESSSTFCDVMKPMVERQQELTPSRLTIVPTSFDEVTDEWIKSVTSGAPTVRSQWKRGQKRHLFVWVAALSELLLFFSLSSYSLFEASGRRGWILLRSRWKRSVVSTASIVPPAQDHRGVPSAERMSCSIHASSSSPTDSSYYLVPTAVQSTLSIEASQRFGSLHALRRGRTCYPD